MGKQIDEELLNRIEEAAAKGAQQGNKGTGWLQKTLVIAAIVAILFVGGVFFLKHTFNSYLAQLSQEIQNQFAMEDPVGAHDLVQEDDGIMGYTASDFAQAVLGDASQLRKIEVYQAKLTDAVTLTETGLGNFKVFTKSQVITYNGTATYTVDLSHLSEEDIILDEGHDRVIIQIPRAECGTINIPSDEMEFGDVDRGWLAFGDINMTAEQLSAIETEARARMEQKLIEMNQAETADRFAVMTIWEMYQPIVSSVSPKYQLEIVFKE